MECVILRFHWSSSSLDPQGWWTVFFICKHIRVFLLDQLSNVVDAVSVIIYSIFYVWKAIWDVFDGLSGNICGSREDLRIDSRVDWLRERYFYQDVCMSWFKDFVFVYLVFLTFGFVLSGLDFFTFSTFFYFWAGVHKNSLKRFGAPWIHEWCKIKPRLSFHRLRLLTSCCSCWFAFGWGLSFCLIISRLGL